MIIKENEAPRPTDRQGQAGRKAEDQMAFYLKRAFQEARDVLVFNNLRLEREGDVAQIDHLVLHRYGFVIVESKSVTGSVTVNRHGEFTRTYGSNTFGMQSPIVQAKMQRDVLQNLLNDHKEQLRRKVMFGLKQASFASERFAVLVAISDSGVIVRQDIDPPELMKADAVVDAIRAKIELHDRASGLGGAFRMTFGSKQQASELEKASLVPLEADELNAIEHFLHGRHQPVAATAADIQVARATAVQVDHRNDRQTPEAVKPMTGTVDAPATSRLAANADQATFRCKKCDGQDLQVAYGKYGYYFKCQSCQGNSGIDVRCAKCGQQARIRKDGNEFAKVCDACNANEHFFTNRA